MGKSVKELIEGYISIRDQKTKLVSAHKAQVARINTIMNKIEHHLQEAMEEAGTESMKTVAGSCYKVTQMQTKVEDRSAFINFIRETESWDFLESKANKTAVEDYLEEHQELPPGVTINRRITVNVRRT